MEFNNFSIKAYSYTLGLGGGGIFELFGNSLCCEFLSVISLIFKLFTY